MGNMHLVTGYAGQEHITAADQGAFHTALFGSGQFVLGKGNRLAANVISNNLVRVLDGDLIMQGRYARLNEDTFADLAIENGEQGKKRHDLVVARYTRNTATGVEDVNLVVIKGTAVASNPADPKYTDGDLLNAHDAVNDMPLYRLVIDGLNVAEPVQLFTLMESTLPSVRDEIQPVEKGGTGGITAEEARENLSVYSKKYIDNLPPYYTEDETFSAATKGEYGYKSNAVPDTALAAIAPLLQHWWRRKTEVRYVENVTNNVTLTVFYNQNYAVEATWYYADGYDFDETTGTYSLTGAIGTYIMKQDADRDEVKAELVGKFIATAKTGAAQIYYISADTQWKREASGNSTKYTTTGSPVVAYNSVMSNDAPEFTHSPNMGAVSENDMYEALGIPLIRAVTAPKIEVGSYIGTGTFGAANSNSLTPAIDPKLLVIMEQKSGDETTSRNVGFWICGSSWLAVLETNVSSNEGASLASVTGKTIKWHHSSNCGKQLNNLNSTYLYFVLGM